jgi:putative transposase
MGRSPNRPVYAAIGVTLDGRKDILGLWAGTGGEGAKFWMSVLLDMKNRGVRDVFFLICDGLKGLPAVVANVWPQTTVQTCIIHLIRNTFRLASKRDQDALKRDVKPIYTAVNATAARAALDELAEKWGARYGAIIRLQENAWEEFIPFLDYDLEIRTVICSTDAIESLNARYRRAVKARGHFPTELAALSAFIWSPGPSTPPARLACRGRLRGWPGDQGQVVGDVPVAGGLDGAASAVARFGADTVAVLACPR